MSSTLMERNATMRRELREPKSALQIASESEVDMYASRDKGSRCSKSGGPSGESSRKREMGITNEDCNSGHA
eukprot:scaffold4405_cov31-Tisochrysis_lutea.AAC.5